MYKNTHRYKNLFCHTLPTLPPPCLHHSFSIFPHPFLTHPSQRMQTTAAFHGNWISFRYSPCNILHVPQPWHTYSLSSLPHACWYRQLTDSLLHFTGAGLRFAILLVTPLTFSSQPLHTPKLPIIILLCERETLLLNVYRGEKAYDSIRNLSVGDRLLYIQKCKFMLRRVMWESMRWCKFKPINEME